MPLPRLVPAGIDGGLVGTVLLDIVLTWIGSPVWWLRWLARFLTVGTVAANGAAGWPDPVAVGLHIAAPLMMLAMVEAARSVLLRRTGEASGGHRESIPLARWLLAPWPTWLLWRRMVLWQVTSYRTALETEQRRLRALYRLRDRYGSDWQSCVADDLAWMLREGVLLEDALAQVESLTGPEPPASGRALDCVVSRSAPAGAARQPGAVAPDDSADQAGPVGSGAADRSAEAGLPLAFADRPDEELVTDMCLRWPGARPSRESVRTTYRIGAGRARRIVDQWRIARHRPPYSASPDRSGSASSASSSVAAGGRVAQSRDSRQASLIVAESDRSA
jgi:hypothetical protein